MTLFVKRPLWPPRRHPMRYLSRLPRGVYEGANRYDTDTECVLHLWRDGKYRLWETP